jgi:hypothetical protein
MDVVALRNVRRACLWYAEIIVTRLVCLDIPEACARSLILRWTSFAGSLGGRRPRAPFGWRGARGAEPARIHGHSAAFGSGEREGGAAVQEDIAVPPEG